MRDWDADCPLPIHLPGTHTAACCAGSLGPMSHWGGAGQGRDKGRPGGKGGGKRSPYKDALTAFCCWARRKPSPRLECQGPPSYRGSMYVEDGMFIQTRRLWPAPLSQQRTQALPHPWVTSCESPQAPEGEGQEQIPSEALLVTPSLL